MDFPLILLGVDILVLVSDIIIIIIILRIII